VTLVRVLGLDVGERRIGIALSDALGLTAQRLMVLERRTPTEDTEAIARLAVDHGAERIVVGLPLTMRGQTGPQAQKVQAFVRRLQEHAAIPVEWIDERLTTVQGERSLRETGTSGRKRKQVIDQVAAQLILQQYLDAKRSA